MTVLPEMNPQVFDQRRQKLCARVGAPILVFGHGSALGAGSKSHGAMRYLTGWDSHEASSLLLITGQGARLMVASPFLVPVARERLTGIKVLDLRPADWPAALGLSGPVGVIGFEEMPGDLRDSLGLMQTFAATPALDAMRLIKGPEEIALHRAGAAICDALFAALPGQFDGARACWEIQLELETMARRMGADYCRTWLSARPVADYPRFWPEEGQHVPGQGDQVLFGIALTVAGHWAHGIRMGALGPGQPSHRAMWVQVCEMLAAGQGALRPGAQVAECEAAMSGVLQRHHDADTIGGMVRFRNGHGLGQSYEDPLITPCFPQYFGMSGAPEPAPDLTVQEGMLLELHPNFFLPGQGGAAIGQMVLIGADGNDSLISHPIDFFEV